LLELSLLKFSYSYFNVISLYNDILQFYNFIFHFIFHICVCGGGEISTILLIYTKIALLYGLRHWKLKVLKDGITNLYTHLNDKWPITTTTTTNIATITQFMSYILKKCKIQNCNFWKENMKLISMFFYIHGVFWYITIFNTLFYKKYESGILRISTNIRN
jgi:hypothetical protein